jgi:multiple sugar transport system permease protein
MANLRPLGIERVWLLVFLLPTLLGLALGAFGSILASFGISFMDWDLLTPPQPAGVSNYLELPGLYVPLTVVISLFVALGLNRRLPGTTFFRVAFFLPTVSSPTAVGLLWTWIYAQDNGLLNEIITAFGGDPVRWLSRDVALWSVTIANVWGAIGGGMIIFLAGLQAIPRDYYEVAEMDGANAWQRLWFITLPALAPSMFFQAVLTTINAFQAFDYIYILTRTGNGNSNMPTMVFSIYRSGFRFFRMGDAAAQAVVLTLMILVLSAIYFRLQKKWGAPA